MTDRRDLDERLLEYGARVIDPVETLSKTLAAPAKASMEPLFTFAFCVLAFAF